MENAVDLPTCHNCGLRDARLKEFERCPMCRVVHVLAPSQRPSSPIAVHAAAAAAPIAEPWWMIVVSSAVFIGLCYAGVSFHGYHHRLRSFDIVDALVLAAMIAYWRLRPSLTRLTGNFLRLLRRRIG